MTLLSRINKLIIHVIHIRVLDPLMQGLRKELDGFRPHCSCVKHINTIFIVEQLVEWLLFIFDISILRKRSSLLNMMRFEEP